jgi:hypothetical protein
MKIVIGGIYRIKNGKRELTRIFRYGGAGLYSGRGCTPETAIPSNHFYLNQLEEPTVAEIQEFLAQEIQHNMAQTWNH